MNLHDFFALRSLTYQIPREHHAALIEAIASIIKARTIVELGSGDGHGTAAFIAVAQRFDGRVWSVDIVSSASMARHYRSPHAEFVLSDSVAYAEQWRGPVDIVYCDSDHSRKHVLAELEAWSRHHPRLFLVDDTLDPNGEHGSPLEAVVDFCAAHSGWSWWNIPIHTGLAIVVPS